MCPLCAGNGFLKAAPLNEVNPAAEVTVHTNPRVDWHDAVNVPCWACFSLNLEVFA